MSVTLTWSQDNGGGAISSVYHGSGSASETLTEKLLFIRHNGISPITQCKFYLAPYAGIPTTDYTEILGWGDAETAADFGGLLLNMNANGGFPSHHWPTYDDKYDGTGNKYNVFRTGVGDTSDNGILLPVTMGLIGSAGVLQAGDAPNVSFKCKIQIPSTVSVTGTRRFDHRLKFSYTS